MKYEIKKHGRLKYFFKYQRSIFQRSDIYFSTKICVDPLKEIGTLGCKVIGILIEPNHRLGKENDE